MRINKKLGELYTTQSTLEYKDTFSNVYVKSWSVTEDKTWPIFALKKSVVGIDTSVLPVISGKESREETLLLGEEEKTNKKQSVKEKC